MTSELVVLLSDRVLGRISRQPRGGQLELTYDEEWRSRSDACPLSLSMPLTASAHGNDVVTSYLWGLLPDNEMILDAWAKRFQVSARNAFALLAHIGEDCAGAARFVVPERVGVRAKGTIEWLRERDVAARLRALHRDPSAWRTSTDAGQFSLGGAQPKTALFFDGKRWGVPSGRVPTTHILKPGAPHLDGHAENEHVCLLLAREAGLPVATSRVARFEDEVAICLERYDRVARGTDVVRIHQEDCCQALGVPPVDKYESTGGPGVRAITDLLRQQSTEAHEDIGTLIAAVAFNWIIAGTDAHAKNYSVLLGGGGAVRLAPLYDIASYLPYAGHQLRKLKLAMSIGGKHRLHDVGAYQWSKLARDVQRDEGEVRATIHAMCEAMPDHVSNVMAKVERDGLAHSTLPALARMLRQRAKACASVFER